MTRLQALLTLSIVSGTSINVDQIQQSIDAIKGLLTVKQAFVPAPGQNMMAAPAGAPMDPSMAPQGAPPPGAVPPGAPMDPSMAPPGAAPAAPMPPAEPAPPAEDMGPMFEQIMATFDSVGQAMTELSTQNQELNQRVEMLEQALQEMGGQMESLTSMLESPAPVAAPQPGV